MNRLAKFSIWPVWLFPMTQRSKDPHMSKRDLRALVRQRRELAELDEHLLRDIGVSRDEADAESSRPAWDVPSHWRQKR